MLKLMGATGATAALVACGGATATQSPTTAPTTAPAATDTPAEAGATEAVTSPVATTVADTPAATEATGQVKNSVGKLLPADAAPPEQQVYLLGGSTIGGSVVAANPGTDAQITGSVYNRSGIVDIYNPPLTWIDHDFNVVPGVATEWKVSDDGLTWTFKLRQDLAWSDGNGTCNADDFIATMQHMADPKTAYDFTWFWSKGSGNIKNFDEAVAGTAKVDEVGIGKVDDYTLTMTTSTPTPYLPRLAMFFDPFNAKLLAEKGAQYISDPATSVVCGQYKVKTWDPTRFEAVANDKAPDDIKPYVERIIAVPYQNNFQAYQAGQLDATSVSTQADIETVLNDPELSKEATPDVGDFRTDYFFFDVTQAPYDNEKFRQALAHLLDRENIVKNIIKPILAKPAYAFLAPGFPAANEEALKDIQAYDPDKAKQLFADSGVKVDKLTIIYRDDYAPQSAICAAYADAIKTNLGITVEVKAMPTKEFTAALLAKPSQVAFGFVSYGMDYMDPSNMLSVFKGTDQGGRHTWNDKQYTDLLAEAGPMTDEAKRTALYQQAEKILTESCSAVFCSHRTPVNMWKPYLKGEGFLPGKVNTNAGWAWPANSGPSIYYSNFYIGAEVSKATRNIP
jgi:peptide/nickel transport system substrate-binding protein/oligopeptide transport system substrate-binding protein